MIDNVLPPQCTNQCQTYTWKIGVKRMKKIFEAFEGYRAFKQQHANLTEHQCNEERRIFRTRLTDPQLLLHDRFLEEFEQLRHVVLVQRNFEEREGNSSQIQIQFRRNTSPSPEAADEVRRNQEIGSPTSLVGPSEEPSPDWRHDDRDEQRREADEKAAEDERQAHSQASPRSSHSRSRSRSPDLDPDEQPAAKRRRIAIQRKRGRPSVCEADKW